MNVGLARELGVASVGPRHEVATGLATRPDFRGLLWASLGLKHGLLLGLDGATYRPTKRVKIGPNFGLNGPSIGLGF